jgi:TonB-linked SusC/RagA family outer membrane protein
MRKNLLLKMVPLLLLISSMAWAQERTVTGKVTSAEDGSALPGVNVVVKGTTNGTVTDASGVFTLGVSSDAELLVFSFIGMATQEIQIGNKTEITVSLIADVKQLAEIVVTAQGLEKTRKSLGYSVSEVGSERLNQISEPDAIRSLQGKVPGVFIAGSSGLAGSATRITIRGNSSLTGNNQPLFVVDGIPYNNSYDNSNTQSSLVGGSAFSNRAADIDPSNIETMTVLKGTAASALYGSRAANGVILITTKSGSKKASNKGLEMTYNSSYSIETIANLPDYQNKYGAGSNFNYSEANGSWGPEFGGPLKDIPHPYWNNANNTALPDLQGQRIPYQAYPNNVRDFFEQGRVMENSLSISGGGPKGKLTSVISNTNQQGMVPGSNFERTSFSIGGNARLDNKFNVGGSLTYTKTKQEGPILGANNAVGSATIFSRTLFLPRNLDLQGLPYINPFTNASLFGWLTGQADNPIWSAKNNGSTSDVDRLNGFFNLGYDVTDWLSVNYKVGLNTYRETRRQVIRQGSVSSIGSGRGGVTDDYLYWQEIESNLIFTFNKSISKDISFLANLGHNVNQRTSDRSVYEGIENVFFDIDDIDNTNRVVTSPVGGGGYERQRLVGVYLDAQLGYKNYLFLNLAGRNDWSSTLPKDGNSFFYPSLNTSFVFTEAFNIKSNILNFGKIRFGAGRVGNAPGPYNLVPNYLINPGFGNVSQGLGVQFPFLGNSGSRISRQIADPGLEPEFTSEIEAGIELKFLNSRVGFDLTLYNRQTINQLGSITTPAVTGYTSRYTNFGEVSNKGIELGVDLVPVQLGSFKWNIYAAFTKNLNIVEKLTDGVELITFGNNFTGGVQSVHMPGKPFGSIEGTPIARDPDTGSILINEVSGFPILNTINRGIIGDPNPKWLLGLTNTFSYKGFVLSTVFDIKYGGDLYSTSVPLLMGRGVTTDTEDREKLLIIDGVLGNPTDFTVLKDANGAPIANKTLISVNNYYFGAVNDGNELAIYDGTYYRLREITLGYTIPKLLLSKTPFGSARVSFSGRNLWYFAPHFPKGTNFDPETNTFGSTNQQGFEFTNPPTARRYGVNISLTF